MTHPPGVAGSRAHPMSHGLAAAWFCGLAILSSYPLILTLGTSIPGNGPGDNVAFLWNFWWFRHAMADPNVSFFHTPYLFAPFGTSLVLHTHTALEAMMGATLLAPLPLIAGHNTLLLAGLALNGICAYALAFHEVRRVLPSILAGTIFAASAYITIHLLGHFNLAHAWVVPLAVLACIRCIERPTFARSCVAAVVFAAVTYSDYYYLVYSVIFAAAWWLLTRARLDLRLSTERYPRLERGIAALALIAGGAILTILLTGGFRIEAGPLRISAFSIRNLVAALWLLLLLWGASRLRLAFNGGRDEPRIAAASVVGIAVYLTVILPLALPAMQSIVSGDYVSPPFHWRSGPRGIDLATLILGNPLHPLYGSYTRAAYARFDIDLMEQVAWMGIVPMAILLTALGDRAWTDPRSRRWMWIAGAFFVWALGSFATIAGQDTGMPLPQMLARVVPILSNARIPGRALVMVHLAAAVFCAICVVRLRWHTATIVGLTAAVVLDSAALPFPIFDATLPRGIDERIRISGAGSVLEIPAGIRDGFGEYGRFDHRALIHQTVHGRPIVGGFVARLSSEVAEAYRKRNGLSALMQWPDRELPRDLARELQDDGIRYVVVNTDEIGTAIGPSLRARGFHLLAVDGPRELYGWD